LDGIFEHSFYPAYIFRNVGGNFSSVANSIDGVQYGSIAVAEFTGDGRADIVLSGHAGERFRVIVSLREQRLHVVCPSI
jgi:hypothetical protein